jgi:hypothetical protein
MKIKSPDKTYTGTSTYGTLRLDFTDGVAETDEELPAGVRQYMVGAGYGIDADPKPVDTATEPADPRELGDDILGTRLRDAAVDPHDEDFLPPTNAGKENPHGPKVVAPEIHASQGVRPVKPGEVPEADEQGPRELSNTTAVQVDGAVDAVASTNDRPAGNASRDEWESYALANGKTTDDLDGLGRNEIRDLFDEEA